MNALLSWSWNFNDLISELVCCKWGPDRMRMCRGEGNTHPRSVLSGLVCMLRSWHHQHGILVDPPCLVAQGSSGQGKCSSERSKCWQLSHTFHLKQNLLPTERAGPVTEQPCHILSYTWLGKPTTQLPTDHLEGRGKTDNSSPTAHRHSWGAGVRVCWWQVHVPRSERKTVCATFHCSGKFKIHMGVWARKHTLSCWWFRTLVKRSCIYT